MKDLFSSSFFFFSLSLKDYVMIDSLGPCGEKKLCYLLAKILTLGSASILTQYFLYSD